MRSEIEALEEQLLRAWSPATVEAYGAALRAIGHPRGELIAIDFILERERSQPVRAALVEEKHALQIAWLGERAEHVVTQWGFIEDVRDDLDHLPATLDVVVPYARGMELWGDPSQLAEGLACISAAPRPWLRSLRVRSSRAQSVPIDNALAQRLIAATPALARLHVSGHTVFADVPHPAVEHLLVDGHDAVGALGADRRGCMPSVKRLDLALHPPYWNEREPPPEVLRAGLVHRAAFPQLAQLDLSRNEPRAETLSPNCLGGRTPIFEILPLLEILPHVVELRVPSLRDTAHAEGLRLLIERMPRLQKLEVARMYTDLLVAPAHPTVLPPRVPWPAGNELGDLEALMLQRGTEWVRFDLDEAYEICEEHYESFPANERAAWDALWQLVRLGIDPPRVDELPTAQLQTIYGSIANTDEGRCLRGCTQFSDHAEPTVAVRHIDDYESSDEPTAPQPREIASSERITELERALQASWDLDRLAVYADELQLHGDLRGELIAVGLEHARRPTPALHRRHRELHEQIFGKDFEIKSNHGLARLDVSSFSDDENEFPRFFHGDAARYLGELVLGGSIEHIDASLALVTAEPRPWLRAVRISALGTIATSSLDVTELAVLWPHLEDFELELAVHVPTFRDFTHPRVRRMRITGVRGYETLGGPWPALEALDFAFGTRSAIPEDAAALFTAAKLPALRSLDLSRNEPASTEWDRSGRHQCELAELFDMLRVIDEALLATLAHIRLPSPRTDDDVAAIQHLLDRTPALETLEIVRRYPHGPAVELRHPRAQLVVPAPSTWPPFDRVVARSAFSVDGILLPEGSAVIAMENHYHELGDPGRPAWDALWMAAGEAGATRFRLPAQTLYTAIDALKTLDSVVYDWTEPLAAHLHPLAVAEKTLTIERVLEP